jgi:hypothetical protein
LGISVTVPVFQQDLFMDKSEPVVIARAWADSEASVIKSLLESYSIPCHYSSELPARLYRLPAEELGPIRIFVPASLAEEARRILDEHRRNQANLRLVDD